MEFHIASDKCLLDQLRATVFEGFGEWNQLEARPLNPGLVSKTKPTHVVLSCKL